MKAMTRTKSPSDIPIETSDINNIVRTNNKLENRNNSTEKCSPQSKSPRKQHSIPVVELASDIRFVDAPLRNRALSTPELLQVQPRQRSFSQHSIGRVDALGLSPRKRSVGILEPLQQSNSKATNGKTQAKIGRKPKLRSSKSSPNFQELLQKPSTAMERLVSVDEHECEELDDTQLSGHPLRKVKSNQDLASQFHSVTPNYIQGNAALNLIDLENVAGTPLCSRSNTPRLSSQRSSRSRLLEPIHNAPTITIEEDTTGRQSPLFFATTTRSRSSTPHLEALREHAPVPNIDFSRISFVDDVTQRRHSPDPLTRNSRLPTSQDALWYINENGTGMQLPEQWNLQNGIGEDAKIFNATPRADVLLNLRYSPENSSIPYLFSSKPKAPLLAIERNITNSPSSVKEKTKKSGDGKREMIDFSAVCRGQTETEKDKNSEQNFDVASQKQESHKLHHCDNASEPTNDVHITTQTKDVVAMKVNKPFMTLEELEAVIPILPQQTSQSLKVEKPLVSVNIGIKKEHERTRLNSQPKNGLLGTFTTAASQTLNNSQQGKQFLVNHKPDTLTAGSSEPDKSEVPGQQMESSSRQADIGTSSNQTLESVVGSPPKKGALSSRAVEATKRLYESPKRSQLKTPTITVGNKVKGKGKTSIVTEGKSPQKLKTNKKGSQMGSKPSTSKGKKLNRTTSSDKLTPKISGKKAENNGLKQKDENDNFSRIKKGMEYEMKTEQMLQRFEGRLSGTPSKSGRSSAAEGKKRENWYRNAPSTPVIEDAYPKPDEDEEKLLQKVKVTVTDVSYPRRIKSSLPRRPKQQNATKKGKGSKTEDRDPIEDTSDLKNPKKLTRATSAGLVVEKGSRGMRPKDSAFSEGEDNDFKDFDPEKHTILSGKDWQVIALIRPKTQAEPALSIIAEVDSITTSESSVPSGKSPSRRDSGTAIPGIPTASLYDEAKNQLPNEFTENQHSGDAEQKGDDENFGTNFSHPSGGEDFQKKSVIVPKRTHEQDPPTDLEIDVIQLLDDGKEGGVSSAKIRFRNGGGAKRVGDPVTNSLEKEHSIKMQNDEVVMLDPPDSENHRGSPILKHEAFFDSDHPQQPLQVWSSEDYDSANPNRTQDEEEEEDTEQDTDDDTLDINHNLQKLMKSMRQRSELDVHCLINYRKKRDGANSDTESENSTKVKQNFVLEDGALSQLFGEPYSPQPASDNAFYTDNGLPSEGNSPFDDESDVFASPRLCESRLSGMTNETLNGDEQFEIPFERYRTPDGNQFLDSNDENDSYHQPDTDEEEVHEMMTKTLHAASDSESTIRENGAENNVHDDNDTTTLQSGDAPRLTQEILKRHNQQQPKVSKFDGSAASLGLYSTNLQYKVEDRNNMQSRTSTATRTTDYTDSTLKAELDTAACLGWRKGKELGHGSYGTVFEGLTRDGQLIAVKLVELTVSNRQTAEREYKQVHAEVELLKTLRHENVVRLLGTCLEGSTVQIFMEHVAGGSINALLMQYGSLKERIFRNYTKQILTGVEYLHNSAVVHRDIKGSNVMLMTCGIIKLIDFGCAKRLRESSMNQESHDSEDGKLLLSMRGTPYWMAPEVITAEGHGPKSDVWSIGCTVYEMATTKPPLRDFEPAAAMFRIGNGNEMPKLPRSDFSRSARDFVKKCFIREPQNRPTASDLLQHKFILRTRPKSTTRKPQ